ncbi:integral membrane sensor signal transduction histidine kinase [Desulfovibrio sp. DV]|uniref:sensor histidine kinase n=1 Tax=Desulfovibrio sp. DV TaxID=1844708 RepID=UPI00095F11BD|nr:sensor histidine kinase [Desulfovibrio sp. DV]OLN29780.1 integral membrane sensor signal transduction histidine kinase [Desulfovibrio sp. DV]
MRTLTLPWASLPHLTIRQKVLAGVIIPVLIFTAVGVVSYNYLIRLEGTLGLMEMADDLSNAILEVRRYEKNFLLYGHSEDFDESLRYVDQARAMLSATAADVRDDRARRGIAALTQALDNYQTKGLALRAEQGAAASAQLLDDLRQSGKDMVDLSLEIKNTERSRTLQLVATLKRQLLVSGLFITVSGIVLALLLARKILRALSVITQATAEIGQGNFKALTVPASNDETRHVLEAFNRMSRELKRRQEQLIQEKKLSSLGVLTSGIAHQLNNPLNNISTSCQILIEEQGECDPAFAAKMLGNIQQEMLRARDIVKGLLEFSRAKDFSVKPTPLAGVVANAFRLVSSQVPSGISLSQAVPPDLVLELDAARMQEVLINLLLNAAQAIETPPGSITVTAGPDATPGLAAIVVEDTGVGIPDEDLGKVFDPFYTTKEVGKGTGLGLSIVFGIIEKHHGSIVAEKSAGKGARFVIRLPLPGSLPPETA